MYDRYGITKSDELVQFIQTEKGYTIKVGDKIVRNFEFNSNVLMYYSGLVEKEICWAEFVVLNAIDKEIKHDA